MIRISTFNAYFNQVFGEKEGLKKIKDCGYDFVEFNFNDCFSFENGLFFKDERTFTEYFKDLKNFLDSIKLTVIATRAPALPCEKSLSQKIKKIINKSVSATEILGAEYITVEPLISADSENFQEQDYETTCKLLEEYVSAADTMHVQVLLVNAVSYNEIKRAGAPNAFSSANKLLRLINRFKGKVYACLDTGKAYYAGQNPATTAELLGKNLKVIRLNDNLGINDVKAVLYGGHIVWDKVLESLKKIDFDGIFTIDVDYLRSTKTAMLPLAELMRIVATDFSLRIKDK